ncbi:MAG TPA: hypothetical protein DIW81_26070, partial [Planctomycetaceae bacterium]|nr:hypothetical protein [Planctomycetaceae bacterium]
MLGLLTCYFNPCRYQNIRDNYFRFRKGLNQPITTVELSFDDHFEIEDAIRIRGQAENLLWQKERLLNLGIQSLPSAVDKVAWLDADILFLNSEWFRLTEQALDEMPVVQMAEQILQLDEAGGLIERQESLGSGWTSGKMARPRHPWFHTGFAWACQRDFLPESGLYDQDVIGGADAAMALSWVGRGAERMNRERATPGMLNAFGNWEQSFAEQSKGNLGCIRGDLCHFWHGKKSGRMYVERMDWLKADDFDPATDIERDTSGLWRWSSNKPEMHRQVAAYFSRRNEDEYLQREQSGSILKPVWLKKTKENAMGCNACEEGLRQRKEQEKTEQRTRNVTKWSVGVTTAPREQPTLERSLISLAEAGFESPRLFVEPGTEIPEDFDHLPISQRDQKLGAFPNWYLALTEMVMRDPRAEAYLLCQDDVLYSKGARNYLEQVLWPSDKTGVVSLYCPSHDQRPEDANGFKATTNGWNSWGALAYIFPNRALRKLLSEPRVLHHRSCGPRQGLKNIDS